jgi:membrane carboxypeptidase/penicillin-binding protein
VAYVMVDMLKGVVQQGTGVRLRYKYRLNNPIGGKTGTTQNNSDGWFIGITPQLVTGVWTGAEDRAIHFTSEDDGEGANSALPVFAIYMKKVYADSKLKYTKGDFEAPQGGISIALNCEAYAPKPLADSVTLEAQPAVSTEKQPAATTPAKPATVTKPAVTAPSAKPASPLPLKPAPTATKPAPAKTGSTKPANATAKPSVAKP